MYNLETERKQRRRVAVVAGLMAAVILALIVAIIVVAINKNSAKDDNIGGIDNGAFSLVEETTETKPEEKKTEVKTETSKSTKTSKTSAVSEAKDLPETGPADLLPIASTLGALTTAGAAILMKRR